MHDLSAQIDQSAPNAELLQPLLALSEDIHSTQKLLHAAGALYFGRMSRPTP